MKKYLFLIFLFCAIKTSFSQGEWAPIGAKWYFTKPLSSYPDSSYTSFESIGDTIINNISCKIIQEFAPVNSMGVYDNFKIKHFMYENNNLIYYFENNQFYLLYDFNKNVGEYWVLNQWNDTVYVDSADFISISDQYLKVLYFHNTDYWYFFRGKIIEKIGWTGYFKPFSMEYSPPEGGNLRCYTDDSLTYLLQTPCDQISNNISNNEIINSNYTIFPNPFSGNYFYLLSNSKQFDKIKHMEIYTILGDKINASYKFLSNRIEIEIPNTQQSIYFLVIELDTDKEFIKIIKI